MPSISAHDYNRPRHAPPSAPHPLKDKTNNKLAKSSGLPATTKIPRYTQRRTAKSHRLDEANISVDSEDSWANDSSTSRDSKPYSDGDDDRNASVFSEKNLSDEDYQDNKSYPDDNDEYLLGEGKEGDDDDEEEEEKEDVEQLNRRSGVPRSSQMRKEDKARQRPIVRTKKMANPETSLSKLEKLMNAASFHNISPLVMAPKKESVQTGSRGDLINCVIIRDKRSMAKSLYPRYTMYFQDGEDTIAFVAEKQSGSRTANYHIFDMTRGAPGGRLSKKAGNYMGKLRGSSSGTEYSLFNANHIKEQVGGFIFEKVSLSKQLKEGQIPRKLHVLLPPLSSDNTVVPYQVTADSDMVERYSTGVKGRMQVLQTKEPTFERGQYRLNFHGRVTTPSVKNFQVVDPSNVRDIIAQFGRVDDNTFHLDFKHPLNAFQAFAMALAQFNL